MIKVNNRFTRATASRAFIWRFYFSLKAHFNFGYYFSVCIVDLGCIFSDHRVGDLMMPFTFFVHIMIEIFEEIYQIVIT